MTRSALIAMPHAGEMTLWRVVEAPHPARTVSWRSVGVFCVGLVLSGGAAVAALMTMQPDTVVQTRIVADEGAGRAALSDVALRLAGLAGQPVSLQEGGQALVVTVTAHDPAEAEQRSRSLVDAILDAPVAVPMQSAAPIAVSPAAGLQAERQRIAAAMAAVEAQAAVASASLTTLARDLASANRPADQKPGHETLDKGNAALADLQLQRLQLAAKYQDTYPAVLALDGQIRNLHVFLADEAQRIQTHPATPDAVNTVLNGERDRLLAELTQLDERRRKLATQLAGIDNGLATMPAGFQAPIAPVATAPVLIAAATSNLTRAGDGLIVAPIVAAIGILLSGLAALLAGRSPAPYRTQGLMLEPVPGGMLMADHPRSLPSPDFPSLPERATTPGGWLRRSEGSVGR